MPARVFDRSHIAFEEDRVVADKIQRLPTQNSTHHTLVVFFDSDRTVKYVPISELEHCDVSLRLSRSESAHVVAAFKRAKDYWEQYSTDD